ncbi:MAG: (2Fe-2S) ferredoxin domain-containing protein [Mariprofundus sp.]|nr:(2Fe-2S) ferredoxin domain-containing protein [Mariprofundus sp.]
MTNKLDSNRAATIEVCHGPQCSDYGGRKLSEELAAMGLDAVAGDCRSQCPNAPVVFVENRMITKATASKVDERVKSYE